MTDDLTKWVFPIEGELGRYRVRSRSNPVTTHLVDLMCYPHRKVEGDFNGQCTCLHFETRLKPKLESGAFPSAALKCWHIVMAERMWRRETLASAARVAAGKVT